MATATGSYATGSAVKAAAGITDSTDDTLIGLICDRVNQYIETTTGRILAPVTGTPIWYEDVFEPGQGRLYVARGIRAVSALALAEYTGAAYTTIPAGDYFLRPVELQPAWPYTEIYLSDRPTGGFASFPVGYATVKLTATTGWTAIPDDITEVAITVAVRAWHARQTGQQDIIGSDEMGRPVVSRFLSGRDRDTLRAYTVPAKMF